MHEATKQTRRCHPLSQGYTTTRPNEATLLKKVRKENKSVGWDFGTNKPKSKRMYVLFVILGYSILLPPVWVSKQKTKWVSIFVFVCPPLSHHSKHAGAGAVALWILPSSTNSLARLSRVCLCSEGPGPSSILMRHRILACQRERGRTTYTATDRGSYIQSRWHRQRWWHSLRKTTRSFFLVFKCILFFNLMVLARMGDKLKKA